MTLAPSISDATIWSVPYDRKTFIVHATGWKWLTARYTLACIYLRLITAKNSFIANTLEMPDLSSIGSHGCCQGILKEKYHCTVDLLSDWFGLVCFANKNKNCQLPYSWFQTSPTGGQQYSDTSPLSIPRCCYHHHLDSILLTSPLFNQYWWRHRCISLSCCRSLVELVVVSLDLPLTILVSTIKNPHFSRRQWRRREIS